MAEISLARSVYELSYRAPKELLLVPEFEKELGLIRETLRTILNHTSVLDDDIDDDLLLETNYMYVMDLSRLRTMLYDADDLFDSIAFRALSKMAMTGPSFLNEVRLFFSKSNQLGFAVRTTRHVKAIRKSLDIHNYIIRNHNDTRERLIETRDYRPHNHRSTTHSFVQVGSVIGRDQDREEIIKLLLPEDHRGDETCQPHPLVISVIGVEGSGKTTLAQLVYNDRRVQTGFDLCLWAHVNSLHEVDRLLREILSSVPPYDPYGMTRDELVTQLMRTIRGKKYLLVLDDVRDENAENAWSGWKALLKLGKSGSKVLATTRSTAVAECLDSIQPYYQLSVLSEESAWSLFEKTAFEEGELCNYSKLLPIGKQIVHEVGYLPLDIVIVGSKLSHEKKEIKTWLSVLDNIKFSEISQSLKCCFAYCSFFPKDHTFDKDELVCLWLAQGFLEPGDGRSLEEVGDGYLFSLADKGILDVESYRGNSCPRYRVRIHELATQVSGGESECLFEEDLKDIDHRNSTTLRHVSIHCDPNHFFEHFSLPSLSKTLRTFLFHNAQQFKTDFLSPCLARCKALRTLQLSHLNLRILPNLFGDLIHLRYLDLSYNWNLEVLPNSVCKLYQLQTLKLEGCVSLKKLPSKLRKLLSLSHLFIDKCSNLVSLPSGLASLDSLVTLDRLVVHPRSGGLRYVENLNSLRGGMRIELPVEGWKNCVEDARKSKMSRKCKLDGMNICWVKSGEDSVHGMARDEARRVLDALEPHKNLEYVNIDGYVGDALSSWVFSLSNVKELILTNFSSEYLDDMVRSYTWLCLETLKINSLTHLKGWWKEVAARENDHMSELPCLPRVSKVVIQNCPSLVESMPSFVGVESLRLLGVNVKLVEALLTQNACVSASDVASTSECRYDSKLKELQLYRVEGLSCLASGQIKHLTELNRLSISGCNQLDWVSRSGLAHLTALETLSISDCGIVRMKDEDSENMEDDLGMPWLALQRLRDLTVPWQRHLQEGLKYLTSLERLEINYWDITQVETDNKEVEGIGMWWKGLARLRQLKVRFGYEMKSCFPRWIQYLCFLEDVEFCNCKELSLSWTTLTINMKIRRLKFTKVEKVIILVDEEEMAPRNQFSSLEELYVSTTNEEEWIHNIPWKLISSLRTLSLNDIPNLKSLPSGIQYLTSLQQLTVGDCSTKLKNRCTRNGADWPLLSRIPDVDIRNKEKETKEAKEQAVSTEEELKKTEFSTVKRRASNLKEPWPFFTDKQYMRAVIRENIANKN